MTKMAEVESKSEALLIYSVGLLWAGCGLVVGRFRAGTAGDCRADLILDAVNPPGVMNNGKMSVTTGKQKRVYGFVPCRNMQLGRGCEFKGC